MKQKINPNISINIIKILIKNLNKNCDYFNDMYLN